MSKAAKDSEFVRRVAVQVEELWRKTLGHSGRCVVGITVPPSWDPQDPVDPVMRTAEALLREKALPRLLYVQDATVEDQMRGLHALVVPGVDNLDPRFYGGQWPIEGEVNPSFDAFEISCVKLALERDLPFLGTSRGGHVLNVAQGGTLQPIAPSEVEHKPENGRTLDGRKMPQHEVETAENSRLERTVGFDPVVNSYHDQALDGLGRGLKVTAVAPDEVVEGIERQGHPHQAAYQFYPEIDPRFQGLFAGLVEDAVRRRRAV